MCDDHPMGQILVEGIDGTSTCLVCSKPFTRRNPLDKSERRCALCSVDKECEGNNHHIGRKEIRKVRAKFKTMFPKAKGIASRFIEGEQDE